MVIAQSQAVITSSAPMQQTLTLTGMRQIYRARFLMAKKLGFEDWFVAAFGTEAEWLGQFTVMPYDKEDNEL